MGDETAAEEFGSSWPLIRSESFPSDADSGYEPSPAFTSVQASFEWPTAGEDDATASTSADCSSAPNEMRSAAIPIPRRRLQEPRWSINSNDDDAVVDVATQTSLPLGEWPAPLPQSPEAAHPGPRTTPDLLLPPPPLFASAPAVVVVAAASALPPDLVPRIEEQRVQTQRLRWVLAGLQLRRISDDFSRSRAAPTANGTRRRSFPPALLRFD